jgi:hypothetical protein
MQKHIVVLTLGLAIGSALTASAGAEPASITDAEAHSIGVDAYIYFYPLISMDLTRLQTTNINFIT